MSHPRPPAERARQERSNEEFERLICVKFWPDPGNARQTQRLVEQAISRAQGIVQLARELDFNVAPTAIDALRYAMRTVNDLLQEALELVGDWPTDGREEEGHP